jgi:uncharacterized protein involved in exopolysaccharide biosynthesis
MSNVWAMRPAAGRGEWASRPRYAWSDFPTLLWRERLLIVAVFIIIFVLGVGFALTMKKSYEARSSVLVRLGQEYVYEPRAGDAARGAVPDTANVLESEVAILGSDALKERVVRHLTYARIDPKGAAAYAAAPEPKRQRMISMAVTGISHNLGIGTGTDTPVIQLAYKDTDPDRAALVLNTLLEEYLVYRRSVLVDPTSNAFEQQRRSFADRLGQADARYQAFLTSNGIGDFDSEKTSVSQLQSQVEQQRYATETQLKERSGRLASLQAQLAGLSPEISLYHDADITAQTRLADLKTQREQLLSRYRPEAQPVKDLEAQIARLQAAVNAGRTTGQGAQRTGVNPVFQTLQTEKLQLTAEVAALRQSLDTLNAQASELTQRRLRLAELEPQYQSLIRDRDVLQGNVRDFTVKAQQAGASQAIASTTNDNIRIVQRASPPTTGKSLKVPVLLLSLIFAAASGVAAGLLRLFLRPGMPTPASASRTLDLPVLGAAPVKAA